MWRIGEPPLTAENEVVVEKYVPVALCLSQI
jgi:hypothetical protein